MANLRETATWEAGVYQLETSDPVMGGENGIDNRAPRQLANRTLWLKTELAKAVASIGTNKTAAEQQFARKATSVTAGAGLTGGGTLASNIVLSMGKPSDLTENSTSVATSDTHSHKLPRASSTQRGILKVNNTLTSTATDEALAAAQGKALKGAIDAIKGTGIQELTTVTDLNAISGNAFFKLTGRETNKPAVVGAADGVGFQLEWSGQTTQWLCFSGSVVYVRSKDNGTDWTSWQKQLIDADVVDNLTSSNVDKPLSAQQGKVLKKLIDDKTTLKTIDYVSQESGHIESGFYRANRKELNGQRLPSMDIHIKHPGSRGLEYARGIGFSYGGNWDVFTTSYDSSGQYLGAKRILTEVGNQTIGGELTLTGNAMSWVRLWALVAGGKWKWEVNPASATDPRFNFVFMPDGGTPLYASFPTLLKNEKVAYQSWVDTQLNNAINSKKSSSVASSSEDTVATSKAVKTAYDKAAAAATPQQVQQAINNLINSAPSALDTLKELASALGNDANFANTVAGKITQAAPSGTVMYFASPAAPAGWLKANGAAVSRTTYADLYRAIGTRFGAGDGKTTFNLPDLRGEFIRGFDDGRNVDRSRVFGSAQGDAMANHNHGFGRYTFGNNSGEFTTLATSHAETDYLHGEGKTYWNGSNGGGSQSTVNSKYRPNMITTQQKTVSGETRPRNIALLACIKI